MDYNKKLVFIAACVGIFLFGISLMTLGATLPQLSDAFHLNEIDKGTLASLLPIGILAGSLIFGPVVDKYAYKHLLAVCFLLISVGLLVIAIATSFILLGIAFLLIGAGGGAINGATSSLVSDFSEDYGENKGANLSMMGVFFGVGALGMPLLINLFSTYYSYQQIIAGIGISIIIPLIFIIAIKYPIPKQPHNMTFSNVLKLLKTGSIILLAMILFFQSGWESLINNWTTTYLIKSKVMGPGKALNFLTLFIAVFTLGRFLVGILLRKFSGKHVLIGSTVIALAGTIMASFSFNDKILAVSLILMGIGLASAFPVILGIIGDRFAEWSGTAFGITFTIALTGNILFNYLTGFITEHYGFQSFSSIMIFAGSGTLMLIFIGLSKEK